MAKKVTKRKKSVKKNNELAKRDRPEIPEILKTITRNGKELNVERWHITGINSLPSLIAGSDGMTEDQKEMLELKLEAMRVAIGSDSKNLQDEAIGSILSDLVVGAYQDRFFTYGILYSETKPNRVNSKECYDIMKIRQSADTHLLNILKAVRPWPKRSE